GWGPCTEPKQCGGVSARCSTSRTTSPRVSTTSSPSDPTRSSNGGRTPARTAPAAARSNDTFVTCGSSEPMASSHAGSSWSGSASRDAVFDVGSFEREAFDLGEVDGESRLVRIDTFAPDRLGDAVALLYERYAELLPDGAARARAAATARSVVALLGPPDHWPFAPDAEATDHRTVGFGSVRGGDAVLGA